VRAGTVDYSKWDSLDLDDDEPPPKPKPKAAAAAAAPSALESQREAMTTQLQGFDMQAYQKARRSV
jgi:hypothetical protein